MREPARPAARDEAADILRRLEPLLTAMQTGQNRHGEALTAIQAEQRRQAEALTGMQTEQRRQAEVLTRLQVEVGELRGRVSQLPTLIQIIGSVLAIYAGMTAIAFGFAKVLAP